MKEAEDFREECDALAALLSEQDDSVFGTVTQFKGWTIEDVIAHLHMWNVAAGLTLESREKFQAFLAEAIPALGQGGHLGAQRAWLDETQSGVRGRALFDAWADFYPQLAERCRGADPDLRVAWAGPDMSVAAKMTARQMETWAHGQEVFDALGAERAEGDRIKNICHLGVTTYSWTFRNRGEEPPQPKPFVKLAAPSGKTWEWNDPQDDNAVSGSAVEFAQVVTQTRNVADTALSLRGENASRWMAVAQCFAGAPEAPPAPGARFRAAKQS
jgi:uncharacterized protein (TIGR03084 family)